LQKNLGENGSYILFFDYNDKDLKSAAKALPRRRRPWRPWPWPGRPSRSRA